MYVKHKLPADAVVTLDERNQRVKLLACGADPAETAAVAVALAEQHGLEKIWGFVSPQEWIMLAQVGFTREGTLDGYYADRPGIAVARYLTGTRAHSGHLEMEDAIVNSAVAQAGQGCPRLPAGYTMRLATPTDAARISRMLREVFSTYPTPVDTAADILASMARDVMFAGIFRDETLVGVASADIDPAHRVAEMTDCAVSPAHRGHGLMLALLDYLETQVNVFNLRSVYTLARGTSVPMNLTFARLGYAYRGRLLNNCNIAGDWEDMHLWVKVQQASDPEDA